MTITCAVRPEWRDRIPAAVHIDGTARPQIIRDETNPLFAGILRRFRDATGLPVLVNTSFNVHEEPIVNRPSECLRALLDGRVDFVVTNEYDLGQPPPLDRLDLRYRLNTDSNRAEIRHRAFSVAPQNPTAERRIEAGIPCVLKRRSMSGPNRLT